MGMLAQLILGIVIFAIGIIIIFNHKKLAKMAIESQKGVDSILSKEQDYSGIRFTLIPRIVILFIGISFFIFGIITQLII